MSDTDTAAVSVGPRGFSLGGEALPFLGGAMHYFRAPRRHWGRCLDAYGELGLPVVESYVPWGVHERGSGEVDFGDGVAPDGHERDLGGFLEACARRGLKVILRPGPHVNAELPYFGYPRRILEDPRCLAVGARGNNVILPVPPRAFPVPSYGSKRFHQEAGAWLRAFGDFVAPFCWPDGPVVALQVDNELGFFFRTGAYDQDYHPDVIERYRQYLARRHPDGLPGAYGEAGLDALEPPRALDASDARGLLVHLDWLAFREWLVVWALSRMARELKLTNAGKLPLFHNFPATNYGASCGLPAAEAALDFAGLDLYQRRQDHATVKRAALLLAGSSRLPVIPELGWGCWPWWFPMTQQDNLATALTALMHGVRGFNLYMLVEREQWYGAPISSSGARRPGRFEAVQQLVAAVERTGLFGLDRAAPVALMQVRDYERLTLCTSLVDPVPPMMLDLVGVGPGEVCSDETFGLQGPVALEYDRALKEAEQALRTLRLPYVIVDSEVDGEVLSRHAVLLVPAFDFIDPALLDRLTRYVEGGGALLLSPRAPGLDREMSPLSAPIPAHQLAPAGELTPILKGLADRLGLIPPWRAGSPDVELSVFTDGGRPAVVFAANLGGEPLVTSVEGLSAEEEEVHLQDAVTGLPADPGRLALDPYQVRMLRLRRAGARDGGDRR